MFYDILRFSCYLCTINTNNTAKILQNDESSKYLNGFNTLRAMKSIKELMSLWKDDANWNNQSAKSKAVIIWFGISLFLIMIVGLSWFTIPVIINFILACKAIRKVEVS